jgi:hypothetical protein
MDPGWRNFTARMIAKSEATVVPLYFDGHNSRLFQMMSHVHTTLRMGLLIKEFRARVNSPVRVVVGEPIPREELARYAGDPKAMMAFLRERTYALSPTPLDPNARGFEFEDQYRDKRRTRRGAGGEGSASGIEAAGNAGEGQGHGGWHFRFGAGRSDRAGRGGEAFAGRALRLFRRQQAYALRRARCR